MRSNKRQNQRRYERLFEIVYIVVMAMKWKNMPIEMRKGRPEKGNDADAVWCRELEAQKLRREGQDEREVVDLSRRTWLSRISVRTRRWVIQQPKKLRAECEWKANETPKVKSMARHRRWRVWTLEPKGMQTGSETSKRKTWSKKRGRKQRKTRIRPCSQRRREGRRKGVYSRCEKQKL